MLRAERDKKILFAPPLVIFWLSGFLAFRLTYRGHIENTGRYACTGSHGRHGAWQIVKLKLTKLKLTLTLFLTLTDTGGAVLTLTKIIN